ncbi:AMP-binding protein [Solimonas terrae]|uniref:AMP-binding protein n=1 Tax=Solimonas terrae TaxID=1396819 RepID=A0A6M2BKG3_9GAMM|nr:AMP-binding protein [Solimonas terrae]NGY03332.1 AMP-binding protein [Solimonas terrae]
MKFQPIVRTIRDLVAAAPDAKAITCEGVTVTRHELDRASNRMARAFESAGVKLGDFVTLALPNSIDFYVALFACWKIGAVPQTVSHRLPNVEREAIVELANPALIVGVDPAAHPGRRCFPLGFLPDPSLSDEPLEERISPILKAATSGGSTGRPKLILAGIPAVNMVGAGSGPLNMGMQPDDCQLIPGPLYHNTPFVLSVNGLLEGQHIVVMPAFDALKALEMIQRYRITFVNFVPTMLSRMLKVIQEQPEKYDLSSIRVLWHMAAPCPEWLKQAWIDLIGPEKVWEMYGGTETISVTAINGSEWLDHRGSVGKPIAGGQMKVLTDAGEVAKPGEVGEIYMRGPEGAPPSYRYVGAEKKEKDGWESLGDLGWMDEDGFLYISDRRTDMIVVGGANIYPAEVEAAIDSHPLVRSCAVVGLPDADLGKRVHAVVHADPGLQSEDLLKYLGEKLARYKVPRSVEFVDYALRDDAGKVRRSAVRDSAIQRLGLAS